MDVDIGKLLKDESSSKYFLQVGKEVEGILVGRDRKKLYIDLSPFGMGVIYKVDLIDTHFSKTIKSIELGSKMKGKVASLENEEGYIEISLKELNEEAAYDELSKKARDKEIVAGKVVDANKGGLMVDVQGGIGFLPSSQLAPEHYPRATGGGAEEILKKLQDLIGQELRVRILSVDPQKQSLILSEKAALEGDLRKKLEKFKEGDVVLGEIIGTTEFGAFMRFGEGLEGLIHISELDWRLVSDPKEVVKIGDKVKAQIIKIAHNEVNLSLKALKKDPWIGIEKKYPIGKKVKAIIKELHPFGAFAFINDSIHGLVHISQFGSSKRMEQALQAGEEYTFEIVSLDPAEHRMGLKLIIKSNPPAGGQNPKSKATTKN